MNPLRDKSIVIVLLLRYNIVSFNSELLKMTSCDQSELNEVGTAPVNELLLRFSMKHCTSLPRPEKTTVPLNKLAAKFISCIG